MTEPGTLYLCATPIGNLEDITLRVLRVLKECDAIWAEDTRRTLRLLNHFGIKRPLVSCHAHNEAARAQRLLCELRAGKNIAYCSDAGMPGISDPGAKLLHASFKASLPATVLPGPAAVTAAAVLSGLPCETFSFLGFLPRDHSPRRQALLAVAKAPGLLLFYESPQRTAGTLNDLREALGDRPAALLRELTKLHEEVTRGTLTSLAARFCEPLRGECVIAVGEASPTPETGEQNEETALCAAIDKLLLAGFSAHDAALAAAAVLSASKNRAYKIAIRQKEGGFA
ncbi:MAG: 16S rRNA (cytidine(1402)-2'-O)-methyltransferase [Clostridiales bacterium]|jgi:16S rRNA (cytidine1402-2'-O)-methyltransferase|nr:16S rRNA (cytidine(1402)-2'-O)-methyltransferase [Clostridiales bacterium]